MTPVKFIARAAFLLAATVINAQQLVAEPTPNQEELEQQFAEAMTGATLVGNFTIEGQNDDKPLKEDRYTLGKVSKLKNGLWSFESRIQYGNHDVKVALALAVAWAGDTPVITLTDATIPGLGTYTARVLVYRNHYAGTWSGRDHGGQMFGRIERAGAAQDAVKPAESKTTEK